MWQEILALRTSARARLRARLGAVAALVVVVVAACSSARADQHAEHAGAARASVPVSTSAGASASPAAASSSRPAAASPNNRPGATSSRAAVATPALRPSAVTPPTPNAKPTSRPSPPSSTSSTSTAAAAPPPAAPSGSAVATDYRLTTNRDGSVVRWNPCAPIHYTVNAALAADPAGALADTQAAIGKIAAASGLAFVYDGPTTLAPTRSWLDDGTSASSGLVIAWAARGTGAGQSDLFGADADGEGGWWESGVSKDGQTWTWQIKRGFVVIDPAGGADYAPGFGAGQSRGVLLMHELGHAVGLGHVDNPRDVMFPVITPSSRAQWGPGDLAGLALVGKGAGCIS